MPVFGINNIQHTKKLADALDLPTWLVKVIIVEYLPCRRFQGNVVTIDYGLVTVEDIKSIAKPYVILNGLALFHNVTKEVLGQRILSGMVGFPMANRLFPTLSEPACFDKEGAALIDCYRYVLVLLCDKEHVVDGLSGHHLALFTSS